MLGKIRIGSKKFFFCRFVCLCRRKHYLCTRNEIAGWSSWQLVGLITQRSEVRVLPPLLRIEKAFTRWVKAFFRCGLLRKGVEEGGGTRQSFRADSGLTVKVSATASSRAGVHGGARGFAGGSWSGSVAERGGARSPAGGTNSYGGPKFHTLHPEVHTFRLRKRSGHRQIPLSLFSDSVLREWKSI